MIRDGTGDGWVDLALQILAGASAHDVDVKEADECTVHKIATGKLVVRLAEDRHRVLTLELSRQGQPSWMARLAHERYKAMAREAIDNIERRHTERTMRELREAAGKEGARWTKRGAGSI